MKTLWHGLGSSGRVAARKHAREEEVPPCSPTSSHWQALTFCFDLERCAHQGKERGIEGDGAITVQGHVHAHQAL